MKVRIEDDDGKVFEGPVPELGPEPGPVLRPRDAQFPLGPGFFSYCQQMADWWREVCGGTWGRYQTLGFHNNVPRDFPCLAALGPTKDPRKATQYVLEHYRFQDPNLRWIHLWDEQPWDEDARYWADFLTDHDTPFATGPFNWNDFSRPTDKNAFSISYQNCTRRGRRPRDFWYHRAYAAMLGKPLGFSANLLDSDVPATFADPGLYEEFLDEAVYADALLVWGADRLFAADEGRLPEAANIEAVPRLCELLRGVEEKQRTAVKRREVSVFFGAGDWRHHKAACRIISDAGCAPAGTLDPGVASLYWSSEESVKYGSCVTVANEEFTPKSYRDVLRDFNDFPNSTPEVVAELERIEAEAGAKLRARLEE